MSEHRHDEARLVAHHRTYERLGQELEDDVYVACAGCLAELGLYSKHLYYPDSAEWILEVFDWEDEIYPYVHARPGEPCYRPDDTWPPSMNEVWLRRGDGR